MGEVDTCFSPDGSWFTSSGVPVILLSARARFVPGSAAESGGRDPAGLSPAPPRPAWPRFPRCNRHRTCLQNCAGPPKRAPPECTAECATVASYRARKTSLTFLVADNVERADDSSGCKSGSATRGTNQLRVEHDVDSLFRRRRTGACCCCSKSEIPARDRCAGAAPWRATVPSTRLNFEKR